MSSPNITNNNLLSTDEFKKIILEAKSCQIPEIVFFGGEPLVNEDIINLIDYTTSLGLESVIFTNGILLTEKMVNDLKKAGLKRCNISLDSSSAAVHDMVRRYDGCFEKAIEGLKQLLKAGIKCSIWTYASKNDVRDNNLADLKKLISTAKTLGVDNIMILFPMAAGNWAGETEDGVLLNAEEREKVRKLFNPPFVNMEFPTENSECTGGKHFIYVSPEGDIYPCPSIPLTLGNIRTNSLKEILKKMDKKMLKYQINKRGECIANKFSA